MLNPKEKENSMIALSKFKELINYKRHGTEIKLNVKAIKTSGNKVLYNDETLCIISYNTPYMQWEVSIIWNINEESVKELALHYMYNTNFQKMSVRNNKLIIEDTNSVTIILAKE